LATAITLASISIEFEQMGREAEEEERLCVMKSSIMIPSNCFSFFMALLWKAKKDFHLHFLLFLSLARSLPLETLLLFLCVKYNFFWLSERESFGARLLSLLLLLLASKFRK
jgi:hypothetical protein